ncbi:unnamed protein product [Bursaphelenchus okinawaensis]|uniref:Uncharacterized protein n=1 Tax=Bursaphelenchus okinawaensis TaxID=465554 RepID=A0A811K265_9BILA|nr:unnamed protein product [Bursaphelenchus okinawaensis]CAG9089994.1 unnamed protein product [Bursaphelenchus okinawaensis]
MNCVSNVAKVVSQEASGFQKIEKRQTSSKSVALKLTAECNKAIQKAIEMGWPVRIVSTETGVTIEVGNSSTSVCTFTCKQQRLNGNVEAVSQTGTTRFEKVSSLKNKLVVNDTDKSFADARHQIAKLADVQSHA